MFHFTDRGGPAGAEHLRSRVLPAGPLRAAVPGDRRDCGAFLPVHPEIIRFVQFMVLAVAIAVVFYTPSIVQTLAQGIAKALGVGG